MAWEGTESSVLQASSEGDTGSELISQPTAQKQELGVQVEQALETMAIRRQERQVKAEEAAEQERQRQAICGWKKLEKMKKEEELRREVSVMEKLLREAEDRRFAAEAKHAMAVIRPEAKDDPPASVEPLKSPIAPTIEVIPSSRPCKIVPSETFPTIAHFQDSSGRVMALMHPNGNLEFDMLESGMSFQEHGVYNIEIRPHCATIKIEFRGRRTSNVVEAISTVVEGTFDVDAGVLEFNNGLTLNAT